MRLLGPVAAVVASCVLAAPAVADDATTTTAEVERLTLPQLIERSQRGTRARMARADTHVAAARADEARAARLPRIEATALIAPSPDIECLDALCTRTSPEDFAIRLSGVAGGGTVTVTQPLYTFGKLTAIREAADAGVAAQRALEDELAGDLAVEAARAYWGLKLARELVAMIEDGLAEIEGARVRLEERLADGSGEATIQDRQRLQTLLAEARIQLTEARSAEATALAGVRAIAGDTGGAGVQVDVDDAALEPIELELAGEPEAIAKARDGRAQVRAADAGARAADRLADFESGYYWPDLAVVGVAGVTRAQGVDDAPSAVYTERFNTTTGAVALVLRWNLEPWTTRAKVRRARAASRRAHELRDLARTGAALDARTAHADAVQARERVTAAEEGETAARAWLASVLQADAIGTAETRDLADAYIAWFQMRARLASAIFQWNVATVRLDRATGEYEAPVGRLGDTP